MAYVLAVDLGGTHTRVAVVGPDGAIIERADSPTRHDVAHPGELFTVITKLCGRHEVDRAVAGLPGRIDYRAGRLEYAPNLPQTWTAELTAERLGQAAGVPTAVANDADLAAAGEAYFGAGRDYADVVFMTVSTGVGAGAVMGGRGAARPARARDADRRRARPARRRRRPAGRRGLAPGHRHDPVSRSRERAHRIAERGLSRSRWCAAARNRRGRSSW